MLDKAKAQPTSMTGQVMGTLDKTQNPTRKQPRAGQSSSSG